MNVVARNYSSGAEMIDAAAAIRARLMNPPKAAPTEKPVLRLLVSQAIAARCQMPKDAHVEAFRQWQWDQAQRATSVACFLRTRCAELGVSYQVMIGADRSRKVVKVRQLLMWEVKQRFNLSYPMIGRHFNGRDHTTILHAIRRVEALKARGEI